jgi:hypothetical protein
MTPASSAIIDKNHDIHGGSAEVVTSAQDGSDGPDSKSEGRSSILEVSNNGSGKTITSKKEDGRYPKHLHPSFNYDSHIPRVPSPDTLSEISVGENGLLRPGRGSIALQPLSRFTSRSPGPARKPGKLKIWANDFWIRNKGLAYVLLAQIFGVLMNVTTR